MKPIWRHKWRNHARKRVKSGLYARSSALTLRGEAILPSFGFGRLRALLKTTEPLDGANSAHTKARSAVRCGASGKLRNAGDGLNWPTEGPVFRPAGRRCALLAVIRPPRRSRLAARPENRVKRLCSLQKGSNHLLRRERLENEPHFLRFRSLPLVKTIQTKLTSFMSPSPGPHSAAIAGWKLSFDRGVFASACVFSAAASDALNCASLCLRA